MKTKGFDASHYQDHINFKKAFKDDEIRFAFFKAMEGTTHPDETFEEKMREAKKAGILRTGYHLLRTTTSSVYPQYREFKARAELSYLDLPPVLDVETNQIEALGDPQKATYMIAEFLELLETWAGRAILYCSGRGLKKLYRPEILTRYDLWIVDYKNFPPEYPEDLSSWKWKFHQFTSSGAIKSYAGNIDLDWFNGSLNDLKAYSENRCSCGKWKADVQ